MTALGEERLAPANGIEIAYQEIGDTGGEPLFLIMGLATQLLGWDEKFCALLAERGYRVVRFDNRDVGHSTKIDEAGVPKRTDLFRGRRSTAAYLLSDMAADTSGLMDHLGVDSAHVVGASMGGMIGQTLAIERPDRVRSLTSIMSNTGRRGPRYFPSLKAMRVLMAPSQRDREDHLEQVAQTFEVIGSPGYPRDDERVREIVGASYDRCHHPRGVIRQIHAVTASGDRTERLRSVRTPTLVIHGDSDPLVRPAGGRLTAKAIPDAKLLMVEGMGHDLPRQLWPQFAEEIDANAARARRGEPQGATVAA